MEDYKFKVVLLGEGRVGKTSMLLRYVKNTFNDKETSTFQAHFKEKRLNFNAACVTLSIWDTAGQERFHALAPIYYRDADAAVLVYDITDRTSFCKVQNWVQELRKIVGYDIILIIAANKIDMENKRQVPNHDANVYARKVGAQVIGTSAKSGKGIEECFLELTKKLLTQARKKQQAYQNNHRRKKKMRIEVVDDIKPPKNKTCCSLI
jgi:Ras-related protein Rab-21